jgi:hypothetical protein
MECTQTRDAIASFIDPSKEDKPSWDAVEMAAAHIRFCALCREAVGSEDRGRFIHSYVLERQ